MEILSKSISESVRSEHIDKIDVRSLTLITKHKISPNIFTWNADLFREIKLPNRTNTTSVRCQVLADLAQIGTNPVASLYLSGKRDS